MNQEIFHRGTRDFDPREQPELCAIVGSDKAASVAAELNSGTKHGDEFTLGELTTKEQFRADWLTKSAPTPSQPRITRTVGTR